MAALDGGDERARLRHLAEVEVEAVAELGRLRLGLRQLRRLRPGDVLVLDTLAGEAAALRVNGAALAEGEVVVWDNSVGSTGLRLTGMVPLRAGVAPAADGPPAAAPAAGPATQGGRA
ncbi:MAG: FliM/FliN family flagellar motor C-terminal domain-containing protein [Candidatus Latescibacterota bacterium]